MTTWFVAIAAVVGIGGFLVILARVRAGRQLLRHLAADSSGLIIGPDDHLSWRAVTEIRVETTDAGPFDEDFFLVVVARGRPPIRIPSPLVPSVLPQIQRLPGFDNETFIKANTSTDNATFVCWKTPP